MERKVNLMDELTQIKIKVFDSYIIDAGSTYEDFLKEKNLEGADEGAITSEKVSMVNNGIEIMGKEEFFKNYLSESEFADFTQKGL